MFPGVIFEISYSSSKVIKVLIVSFLSDSSNKTFSSFQDFSFYHTK